MDLKQALFSLSEAAGPSGCEDGAVSVAKELLRPFVDSVTQDVSGNLIGIRTARQRGARCILLDAHLDEVSLIVSGHDRGFLEFVAIGVDQRILPGLEVRVCTQPPISGVINCLPPHILSEAEREKPFELEKLRIDCGLTEEEAPQVVPIGTRVIFGTKPFSLSERHVCGKSLDDRAGFAVLLRTMELLKDEPLPVDVCVLGATQEEFTAIGAKAGTYNMEPDEAIAVDASFAVQPDVSEEDGFPQGGGPIIGVGPLMNRRMSRRMQALAKEKEIPYSLEILAGRTGTDADEIHITRSGVTVVCVSFPLRYMHTPLEVVDLQDIEYSAQLLAAYIRSAGEESA